MHFSSNKIFANKPMMSTTQKMLFILAIFLLLSKAHVSGRSILQATHSHSSKRNEKATRGGIMKQAMKRMRKGKPYTLQIAGSKLPDCSHACGSCSPCRLVMVSFVCATIQEAETCPMAYKCMCNNKAFPVP